MHRYTPDQRVPTTRTVGKRGLDVAADDGQLAGTTVRELRAVLDIKKVPMPTTWRRAEHRVEGQLLMSPQQETGREARCFGCVVATDEKSTISSSFFRRSSFSCRISSCNSELCQQAVSAHSHSSRAASRQAKNKDFKSFSSAKKQKPRPQKEKNIERK